MTKKYLSICIPTANRKKELAIQIRTLLDQALLNNIADKIQIVISDNTDREDQLIDPVLLNNTCVKYIRNDGNIGYAKNVNNVLMNADGDFAWLLSDDDTLLENALIRIFDTAANNPDASYITFSAGGVSHGRLFDSNMYFKNLKQDKFIGGKDFLISHWNSIIFISINIFNVHLLRRHVAEFGLLDNINEAYQNSLIGITLVNKYGNVVVINHTLLNDNFSNKVYAPEKINDVAVEKYHKLYHQLFNHNVPERVLIEMNKVLFRNILTYGLISTVYGVEYIRVPQHLMTFLSIWSNKNNNITIRLSAFLIYRLLTCNKYFAKIISILLVAIINKSSYSKMVCVIDNIVKDSKNKIPSSY
jgi:glycosyltransferase involved in cell wall biosynthesis